MPRKTGQKAKRICPKCGKPFNYIERRLVGRHTYVFAVHVNEEGRKTRHLIEKHPSPEYLREKLHEVFREARKDPELLAVVVEEVIKFLKSLR